MPSRLFRRRSAALLVLTLGAPAALWPQQKSVRFKVVNATPDEIREVYICSTKATTWGPNLLGTQQLAPGQRRMLSFTGDCGLYDIRMVAPGGKEYMDDEVSFCEDDDVLTIGAGALKKVKANGESGS